MRVLAPLREKGGSPAVREGVIPICIYALAYARATALLALLLFVMLGR
jgi:hypothetical protein